MNLGVSAEGQELPKPENHGVGSSSDASSRVRRFLPGAGGATLEAWPGSRLNARNVAGARSMF